LKLALNIFLACLARTLLYVLSVPLIILSVPLAFNYYQISQYWRLISIVLDIVGCVIGGPVWNLIFFKWNARPVVKFGSIITMSFVFAYNVDQGTLNGFGRSICRFLEARDPGHLQRSLNPEYLLTYYLYWKLDYSK
jgi:hypothetical protein